MFFFFCLIGIYLTPEHSTLLQPFPNYTPFYYTIMFFSTSFNSIPFKTQFPQLSVPLCLLTKIFRSIIILIVRRICLSFQHAVNQWVQTGVCKHKRYRILVQDFSKYFLGLHGSKCSEYLANSKLKVKDICRMHCVPKIFCAQKLLSFHPLCVCFLALAGRVFEIYVIQLWSKFYIEVMLLL